MVKAHISTEGIQFLFHNQSFFFASTSLGYLDYDNPVRRGIIWLITWVWFDRLITFVILVNSILLSIRDYDGRIEGSFYKSERNDMLDKIGAVLTVIFMVEAILKVVGMGLVNHKFAYLRDGWNILDFIVVMFSILDFFPKLEVSALQILRTFRILRPLRSINKVKRMKMLINSLFRSIPGLLNVVCFLIFVLSIFGIFATHQFKGAQYSWCRVTEMPMPVNITAPAHCAVLTRCDGDNDCALKCPEQSFYWEKATKDGHQQLCRTDQQCFEYYGLNYTCGSPSDFSIPVSSDKANEVEETMWNIINFDNFGTSMRSIFVAITLEGWVNMMYNYSDANSPALSAIFFILLVIFGAFFALNLVLAEVMVSFEQGVYEEEEIQIKLDQKMEKERLEQLKAEKDESSQSEGEQLPPLKITAQVKSEPIQSVTEHDFEIQVKKVQESFNDASNKSEISHYKTEPIFEENARRRAKKNCCYGMFFDLVTAPFFNAMIFFLIIVNTIVLANDSHYNSPEKDKILHYFNDFFTFFFFIEMLFKIMGLGFLNYVKDSFNLFDAFLVLISLADWIMFATMKNLDIHNPATELLKVTRACRLLRVFKIARSWSGLQEILSKTGKSLIDIFWFGILLSLFMFVMSLLCMELFAQQCRFDTDGNLVGNVTETFLSNHTMIAPRTNFDSIDSAMTTIFIIIIGEDWPAVMYDYVRVQRNLGGEVYGALTSLVFMGCFAVGNFLLLSLFTAILLNNFEDGEEEESEEEGLKLKRQSTITSVFSDKSGEKTFCQRLKNVYNQVRFEYIVAFGTTKDKNQAEERKSLNLDEKHLTTEAKMIQSLKDGKVMPHFPTEPLPDLTLEPKDQTIDHNVSEYASSNKIPSKNSSHTLTHVSMYINRQEKTRGSLTLNTIEGNSLFCLSKKNPLRKFCASILMHPWFDWIILFFILLTTVCLAMESPLNDSDSQVAKTLKIIDYFMTGIFSLEMIIKIIAMGFAFNGAGSYLRDAWCVLDFVVVIISVFSITMGDSSFSYLKVIRMLRILKPLKMISRMRSLKLAIISLTNSIPDIFNLLVIIAFFILLLAILGTTLLKGKFYRCHTEELSISYQEKQDLIATKEDCMNYGGDWVNQDLNFDSTPEAFITLFTVMSTEGWIDVMWNSVDAVEIGMEPILNYQRSYVLFYVIMILILCMLFINLWVGVVCDTYNKETANLSNNHLLNKNAQTWIQIQVMGYKAKPLIKLAEDRNNNALMNFCIRVTNNPVFESFIMVCILLNTLCLAIVWNQMDEQIVRIMEYLNWFFMLIFTVEAIIKLIALKCDYFSSGWNQFDFIVVIGSLIAVTLDITKINEDIATQATIIRILRVLRVLRIIKRATKLQMIFDTILISLPAMSSLGLLLILIQILFAIIGMQLFGFIKLQNELNYHANFKTFGTAFLLLMRCATGEGWNALMFDSARTQSITFQCIEGGKFDSNGEVVGCGLPTEARLYFITFQVIISQVFLNLFIAIVIDTFLDQKQVYDLPLKKLDIEIFVQTWQKYDPLATGYIEWRSLDSLFLDLKIAETDFFSDSDEILDPLMIRAIICQLEIPLHRHLKSFMFYDVLMSLSRQKCEESVPAFQARKNQIRNGTVFAGKMLGFSFTGHQLRFATYKKMATDKEIVEIRDKMFNIENFDDKVELIKNVQKAATRVVKTFESQVDCRIITKDESEDQPDLLYTSKHVYGAMKIVESWKSFIEKRRIEQQANDSKEAEAQNLNQMEEGKVKKNPR